MKSADLAIPIDKKEVLIQPNDHKNTLYWLDKKFY